MSENIGKIIIGTIVGVGLLILTIYGLRLIDTNMNREIFKSSVTYTESMASFLADSYQEYNSSENDIEKTAILEYVIMRYPNIDINTIDNETLKDFYNKALKGE